MANYGVKYMAEWKNIREKDYRLVILERDYDSSYKRIRHLAGCALEVQGAQDGIIAPIVKTQLRFSLVDAWDEYDGPASKGGNWQEFYTPDATLYKVELYELTGNTETKIWTGYITPDSWQESLDYRGIITVTARDNIGHLKDFPFVADGAAAPDVNGLVEIRYLFTRAMEVIDFPMDFYVESAGSGQYSADVPCTEDGDYLTEACVNAALFDGMDWYQVLERTLEAIGYTFRYVGRNKCVVGCLRNLPKMGHYTEATGSQTMEFYGGSLELDPAVKQIEDEQDYKMETELQEDTKQGLRLQGSKRQYTWKYGQSTGAAWDYYNDGNTGGNGWQAGYGFLRGSDYSLTAKLEANEGADAATAWPMLIANQENPTTFQSFRMPIVTPNVILHIVFGTPLEGKGLTMQILELGISKTYLSRLALRIMFVAGGTTQYWDGEDWDTASHVLEYTPADAISSEYSVDIPLGEADPGDGSYLLIEFRDIQFVGSDRPDQGLYARIKEISTEIGGAAVEKNSVKTINNEVYNVKLNRRPLFSALSRKVGFAQARNYLAGLFYYPVYGSYPELYPYQVRFTDQGSTVPLPVLIHQQILCYYFGAARVLSGNCAPVNKARFAFDKLCTYKGVSYLLQGGTLDLFSGIIMGAVLREYTTFTELWSGGAPEYSEEVIYNS